MPLLLDRKSTRLNSSHLVISYASSVGSEEHTSELQSPCNIVCRLLLEKKKAYSTYAQILTADKHIRSKAETCSSESFNSVVMHFLKRFCFFLNDRATTKFTPFSPLDFFRN